MNELTDEWVAKAESDYDQAQLAMYAVEIPLTDGVCFHSQQCAEKYLKAFLQEKAIRFPREHALVVLLELCLPFDPAFESLRSELRSLEQHAVAVRYPGVKVTDETAKSALEATTHVRHFIRNKFQLK